MAVIFFLLHLAAGDFNFFAVYNYYKITVVHVKGKLGFMLAAQAMRKLRGKAAENFVLGIYNVPFMVYTVLFWAERLHDASPVTFAAGHGPLATLFLFISRTSFVGILFELVNKNY
jgi:hypothetical protein